MKQLSRFISHKVITSLNRDVDKQVVRIDGFEDMSLYFHICSRLTEHCLQYGIQIVAKLANAKFEQLRASAPYEAQQMLQNGWVDQDNRMTYYRNQMPAPGTKMLVLLLGTDMVEDKGGLNDFYAITPHTIDGEIDKQYSKLLSDKLLSYYPEQDKLKKIVDSFFGELFSCVPKNLCRVSSIVDQWEDNPPDLPEIIEQLYRSLPEWQIPRIEDRCPSISELTSDKGKKQTLLSNAYSFIKGKLFTRVTKTTLSSIEKKFEKYVQNGNGYAEDYPAGQAIGSIEELQRCICAYVSGDRTPDLRKRLLSTDYSIVNAILNVKLDKRPPKDKPETVYGTPLSAFIKAILTSLQAENEAAPIDRIVVKFKQAQLCGIPTATDKQNAESDDETDADQLLIDTWRNIAVFAGGVIPFINNESWTYDGKLLDIESSPVDFLKPDAAEALKDDGYLKSATGKVHRISFSIQLFGGNEEIRSDDYIWQIQLYEDWMVAFTNLLTMPDDNSYVPFSTMAELNNAFIQKDDENFAYLLDHSVMKHLDGENSLVRCWMDRTISPEEKEEAAQFWKLGECFQQFRKALLHNGFYSTIGQEVVALVQAYVHMAKRISSRTIYTQKLRNLIPMFVNAFAIAATGNPVQNDIFTPQLIIPPYHPAALEKLADSMMFIRSGIKEWYDEGHAIRLNDRIKELASRANIRNATDAFFAEANTPRSFSKTHGYYTLYGQHQPKHEFVSAQDVQLKEAVFEDDFSILELQQMTREAEVLKNVLQQYIETYPCGYRALSLAFVNPGDLQIVVAALYRFIEERRSKQDERRFSLKLTIISRNELQGARTYLAYWINQMFTADDNLDIKAYTRLYNNDRDIPALVEKTTDIAFFFDALDTDHGATYNFIKNPQTTSNEENPYRFPVVFKPSVAAQGATEHRIVITQPQFDAATAHTQVLKSYRDYDPIGDEHYHFVQSSTISQLRGNVIRELQKRTIWLVCIDHAMDKKTVRDLYADDTGIIGFTTGEGSFGQLNMAITCKPDAHIELQNRCRRKLHTLFPSWSEEQLTTSAQFCIQKARELDGVSILRAMNPLDHDINNYLAYLFASELTKTSAHTLNVLIRLDSYRHWFQNRKSGDTKIPDFLLITADIVPGEKLHLKATVIEAKIANTVTMQSTHLSKAYTQVKQGLEVLQAHFDPLPEQPNVDHRYWLAQLYRALVFLQSDIQLDSHIFDELSLQLSQMLEGNFSIEWDGQILACQLDENSHIVQDQYEDIKCIYVGQLAMQNLLLHKNPYDQGVEYDYDAVVEEEMGNTFQTDLFIAVQADEDQANLEEEPLTPQPEPPHEEKLPETNPSSDTTGEGTSISPAEYDGASSEESQAGSEDASNTSGVLAIEDVRVLIGNDRNNRPVHWEFGHKNLANRHLLITGGSGQGKTYAIQTFLFELARQKISSVVFDYTDGFLPDKLEPPFAEALGERIVQHIAILNRIPINPFKRQMLNIAGMSAVEPSTLVAGRFAAIMKHVFSFGEQQYSALYSACRTGIDTYGGEMDFNKLRTLLEENSTSYSKTVLSKMQQLFDLDLFDITNAFDWSQITERDGKVTVIQLTSLDREIQTVVTEMLMWDAWYALVKTGIKDHPFVVVLDEAQNLSIADGSPAQKILQEGRKYGWSAWFATQFLKGALSSDEISRLQQAAEILYFKPSSEEAPWVAQQLADANRSSADWLAQIKQMQKGHCIVRGDRIRPNNVFGACPAAMVKVSSFEDRE